MHVIYSPVLPFLLLPSNGAQWGNKIFLYHLLLQNEKVAQSASNIDAALQQQETFLCTLSYSYVHFHGRKKTDMKKALISYYRFQSD